MASSTTPADAAPDEAAPSSDTAPPHDDTPQPERYVTFAVAGSLFHCPVSSVREVVPYAPLTRLPGAPAIVVGLFNARGTVVTVIDLGQELFGTPVPRDSGSIMLVQAGGAVAGLLVAAVTGVRVLDDSNSVASTELDVRAIVVRALVTPEEQ